VALTVNVPVVQYGLAPGYDVQPQLPFVMTGTSFTSAIAPPEFLIVTMTAVLGPGAGLTVPLIEMACVPEYDELAVVTVIE
jgi:hypothetical protein